MHAALLTMIMLVGADQVPASVPTVVCPSIDFGPETSSGPVTSGPISGGSSRMAAVPAPPYRYDPPRDPQETDTWLSAFINYVRAFDSPMPQTCYSPHYGCYPGNGRDIYRYPTFHGYYYRQAYNYRPLFEYPWQANPHEPLPLEMPNSMADSHMGNEALPPVQTPEVIPTPVQASKTARLMKD